jgi:hypothetical protein
MTMYHQVYFEQRITQRLLREVVPVSLRACLDKLLIINKDFLRRVMPDDIAYLMVGPLEDQRSPSM